MKLYILTPSQQRFSERNIYDLQSKFKEVIFITKQEEVNNYNFDNSSVIALDADFYEWNFKGEILNKFSEVKAIAIDSTSFSWIDTQFFADRNISIVNTVGTVKDSVAEWAIMCMMMLARKIPLLIKNNYPPLELAKYQGIEIENKIAGIIGLGNVGKSLARKLKGLGLEVIYWSKNSVEKEYKRVELDELFAISDFIFPAFKVCKETEEIMNYKRIESMKASSIIASVDTEMYDHQFVLDRVQTGKLFGYAFESDNNKLPEFQGNVLCLPTSAFNTKESSQKMSNMWTENLINITKDIYLTKIN